MGYREGMRGGGGGGMDRWEGQWQHIHLCNITGKRELEVLLNKSILTSLSPGENLSA